ncbi:MAG TPA: recombinase RecT [Ottowia sp.]|nr:recombinase RecT [Ottowia sp.]
MNQSNAIAIKQTSPLAKAQSLLDKLKPQMSLALPKHLNVDRMSRLALTAFSTNPDLLQCSPQSLAGSIMLASQLGLEIGVGGQGYLIQYKGTATFVPGWKGLVDLVSRAGRATVWTGAVFDGDRFEYQLGDTPFCKHVPGDDDGGKFTHVYAIGRVRDAEMPVIEVWTRAKVEKHLKAFNKVGGRHYALASENNLQMYGRKVALLQVLKYMPSSIELQNATTAIHAAEAGQPIVLEGDLVRVQEDAPQEPERPTLTTMDEDEFRGNLPKWRDLVASGRKTGAALLAMLSTKATFTDAQKAVILALDKKPEPPAGPTADAATDDFVADMTAAEGAAQ